MKEGLFVLIAAVLVVSAVIVVWTARSRRRIAPEAIAFLKKHFDEIKHSTDFVSHAALVGAHEKFPNDKKLIDFLATNIGAIGHRATTDAEGHIVDIVDDGKTDGDDKTAAAAANLAVAGTDPQMSGATSTMYAAASDDAIHVIGRKDLNKVISVDWLGTVSAS